VVAGYFGSPSIQLSGHVVNNTGPSGTNDAFIFKLAAADGSFAWGKAIGGGNGSNVNVALNGGVAVDGSGNVAIAGNFTGTVNFGNGNVTETGSGFASFVAKYAAADGSYLTDREMGTTTGLNQARSVAVDSSGNMYVTGVFSNGQIDVGGAQPLTSAGGYDVYLVKYTASAAHVWSKALGNSQTDDARTVALDANGDVLLTGTFNGTVSYGGANLSSAGNSDIFLAHFSKTDGSHLASMRMGGSGFESAFALAGNASRDVFVGGDFTGFSEFGGQALTAPGGTSASDGFALLLMPLN
jgi:hypothetical protein